MKEYPKLPRTLEEAYALVWGDKIIVINLYQTPNSILAGWRASIGVNTTEKSTTVSLAESKVFATKQEAWANIQYKASQLNYAKDIILFNQERVKSYMDVESLVAVL